MEKRMIKVVLNLTLSEIAELYDKGETELEDVFHQELEYIENSVIHEIEEKFDTSTLHELYEYFKVAETVDHFDFSEFIDKLRTMVFRQFSEESV